MATWSKTKAPVWKPDAIATNRGWVDPDNGHILVACKNIEGSVDYEELFDKGGKKKEQPVEAEAKVDSVQEQPGEEKREESTEQKPKRKYRRRKSKGVSE